MSTKKKPLDKAIENIGRLADQLATEHRKMFREQARQSALKEYPAKSVREPVIVCGADIKIEFGGPDNVYPHIQECILLPEDERMVLRHAEVLIRHIEQAMRKWRHRRFGGGSLVAG